MASGISHQPIRPFFGYAFCHRFISAGRYRIKINLLFTPKSLDMARELKMHLKGLIQSVRIVRNMRNVINMYFMLYMVGSTYSSPSWAHYTKFILMTKLSHLEGTYKC